MIAAVLLLLLAIGAGVFFFKNRQDSMRASESLQSEQDASESESEENSREESKKESKKEESKKKSESESIAKAESVSAEVSSQAESLAKKQSQVDAASAEASREAAGAASASAAIPSALPVQNGGQQSAGHVTADSLAEKLNVIQQVYEATQNGSYIQNGGRWYRGSVLVKAVAGRGTSSVIDAAMKKAGYTSYNLEYYYMVISCILILSRLLDEPYLADVALIYTMISFLSVLILAAVYIPGAKRGKRNQKEGGGEK